MRLLYTSLIAASVLLLEYMDNPAFFGRIVASTRSHTSELLSNKEIRIEGLKVLPASEVERYLPFDRSVLWWHVNGTDIQSKIAESPWVSAVSIDSCSWSGIPRWGCFVVSIKERSPKFVAMVDNEPWIIDGDGAFIMPSGGPLHGLDAEAVKNLVAIQGLASRAHSPDLVRSQLALAASSIATLEATVGRSARSLRFEDRGDFSVVFAGVPFPVVFTASPDAPLPLTEQGERLVALLGKLKDRLGDVARVDLAFARVGVVKFRSESLGQEGVVGAGPKKAERAG